MQNPFESGHIKNYLLLYASVVVIMILFFIASSLFYEVQEHEPKKFKTDVDTLKQSIKEENKSQSQKKSIGSDYGIKLLDREKSY